MSTDTVERVRFEGDYLADLFRQVAEWIETHSEDVLDVSARWNGCEWEVTLIVGL